MYQILENNREYTNWIIKTKRQFTSDACVKMINLNFEDDQVNIGPDNLLFQAQKNHMASVLGQVLQTNEGKILTRKHPGKPWLVWKLHKDHATLSTTSSNICTGLSQELAKNLYFDYPAKVLDKFDSYLSKFNTISKGIPMLNTLSIMYLKSATHGNKELLSAWMQCEAVTKNVKPNTTLTYDIYFEYMINYVKNWKWLSPTTLQAEKPTLLNLITYYNIHPRINDIIMLLNYNLI